MVYKFAGCPVKQQLGPRTELEMNIRCENRSDHRAIAELNRLVFERQNEAQLIEFIRHSDRYIPELSRVAELDGDIAGHILFSYIDLVGQAN